MPSYFTEGNRANPQDSELRCLHKIVSALEESNTSGVVTFIVGPQSNSDSWTYDYTTDGSADDVEINQALSALPAAGGMVLLKRGNYSLHDFISMPSNSVLHLGTGSVVKPENNYTPTSQTVGGYTMRSIVTNSDHTSGNSNIRIQGEGKISAQSVTIPTPNTSGGPSFSAIWFHKVTDSRISGITVEHILWNITGGEIGGVGIVRQYGICLTESHRNTISDMLVQNVGNDCISIRRDSSYNTIRNVLGRYSLYGHAIGQVASGSAIFPGTAGADAKNNTFANCKGFGDYATVANINACIVCHGGKNTTVSDCEAEDCGLGFAFTGDSQGGTLRNALVINPKFVGVWMRTDSTGDNMHHTLSGIRVGMNTDTDYGLLFESTIAGGDIVDIAVADVNVFGADVDDQVGIGFLGSGGHITDVAINGFSISACGHAGIMGDTTDAASDIRRISLNGGYLRSNGYGVRMGARTAAGDVLNVSMLDIHVDSSRTIQGTGTASRGVEFERAGSCSVQGGRIVVTGIAVRETSSTSSNNKITQVDTSASGTRFPELYGAGSEASGFFTDTLDTAPGADLNDYAPSGWSTTKHLRISPTTSIKLTGLAALTGAGARDITVTNGSAGVALIIITSGDTGSAVANRFSLGSALPIFVFPSESVDFIYDPTAAKWRLKSGRNPAFNQFAEFNDYVNLSGNLATSLVAGTGASGQVGTYGIDATEKCNGVCQIDTGTTTTGSSWIGSSAITQAGPALGNALYLCRLAIEQLSTAAQEFSIIAGFNDSGAAANVTDGVYWAYRRGSSLNWIRGASQASTRTETAGSTVVDTTYVWLGIFVNSTWTRADFFISTDSVTWTFEGSVSTNLPSGTQLFGIGASIIKSAGTTQVNADVDFQAYRYEIVRG